MKLFGKSATSVLLVGEGSLLASVAVCLVNAGHEVMVYPSDEGVFYDCYQRHLDTSKVNGQTSATSGKLKLLTALAPEKVVTLAIAILPEDFAKKNERLQEIEKSVSVDTVIAINTETYSLLELQKGMKKTDRLIGLNWAEPAHTTFFLEIISNGDDQVVAQQIAELAKCWGKDPYIVKNTGVRSVMIGAMAREALYLVENGYASVEDIDRACRNDTGYYLPFAGNCRYMDLMGTSAYGMVMKDLNPELSKDSTLPSFFEKIKNEGGLGMENRKGFYNYSEENAEEWKETMEKFSYEIQRIIEKYPFNYEKTTI